MIRRVIARVFHGVHDGAVGRVLVHVGDHQGQVLLVLGYDGAHRVLHPSGPHPVSIIVGGVSAASVHAKIGLCKLQQRSVLASS
jgi:hypothetical protein